MKAELGVNRAGADDRNANIVGSQFLGDRVGQSIQSPLRGGISGTVGESVLSGQGRDVDDVSATCLDHERRQAADAVVDTAQVRVQDALPILAGQLVERASRARDAGIVDENVYPMESALDVLGERLYRVQVRDIALD